MVSDPNKDDEPFTPETLDGYTKRIEDLRCEILFETDGAGADPHAEQLYLLALGHLDMAGRYMALASMAQSRALADMRRK
jgi:hypothetical protein